MRNKLRSAPPYRLLRCIHCPQQCFSSLSPPRQGVMRHRGIRVDLLLGCSSCRMILSRYLELVGFYQVPRSRNALGIYRSQLGGPNYWTCNPPLPAPTPHDWPYTNLCGTWAKCFSARQEMLNLSTRPLKHCRDSRVLVVCEQIIHCCHVARLLAGSLLHIVPARVSESRAHGFTA
ncbi:hypothetical protein M430DRAFT_193410 [Amorphotheca resinae ATCC 22711]|jgi:hypothetical protein|uniref:Uncharacterized protein n=1 Tax=Amorphotheca resinae ATCC 22711 TaxID=857342 RepID=A0A2T3AQ52_AMORE|nr:hypothetical protein M430DRAFT_193410 [Amorphotheca resinae ATCC 22711]PSS07136.1 hypothetical protein M430DRAFT_193410 [Amorphotheca resinae ATCC 22711]